MDVYYSPVSGAIAAALGGGTTQTSSPTPQSSHEFVEKLNASGSGWREGEDRRREKIFDDIVNSTAAEGRVRIRSNVVSEKTTGKVLFATKDFKRGDLVFQDTPLVAMQNTASKQDESSCIGCDRCLKCLGNYSTVVRCIQCEGVESKEEANKEKKVVVRCRCDCGAFYCSRECEEEAWKEYHHMICPARQPLDSSASVRAQGGDGQAMQVKQEFNLHAEETNDIFKLAAKLYVMLLKRVISQHDGEVKGQLEVDAGGDESGSSGKGKGKRVETAGNSAKDNLLDAVIKYAWKAPWNVSVAIPADVEDKEDFRKQFKDLASDSFSLLQHSLLQDFPFLDEPKWLGFFDLELYENLVGMFELNNLGIFGDEGGCTIEGTGFYPIHSCMNHSCDPNCVVLFFSPEEVEKMNMSSDDDEEEEEEEEEKEEESSEIIDSGKEGEVHSMSSRCFVYALRDISKDEEITCSYLDPEDLELDTEARNELLEDYCFRCMCSTCKATTG